MKRASNNAPGHCVTWSSRRGFTLVELLVVAAIITILVALSAGAVIRYIGAQQKDNTETVIRKIQPKLQARWKSVVEQANKEAISAAARSMAGGDEDRARVIHIKLRLRQEFPMNFNEAVDPSPLPPIQEYREAVWRAIPGLRGSTPPASNDPFQNSACLLMALTRATKGQSLEGSDLGSNVVIDSNNDGAQEIIDAWGKPIVLIRFPYKHPALNPGPNYPQNPASFGPQPRLNDDVDTQGWLTNPNWSGRSAFENPSLGLHLVPAASGGSPQTYKLFPILVSGGTNKELGIDFNGGIADVNQANDNIYSYNLMKLGARGD